MFDMSQIVKDWKESAALHAHINLYGFWDEETFLTKSGDLGVVLRVRGIDYESLDSTSRDHAVKRLEAALRTFDPRVRVYQALFKTNQPEIPHQKYANPLVKAAINQRMAYFAAKAEQLFSMDLYWIVVVQGGYAKSTLQQALRQLPAHPHSFLRDIHALFSQVRQRVFLQTQIERDHLLLRQKRPRFALKRLDEINRGDIKTMINELIAKDLSRNTIRNALCVIRGMFNQAIESGLIESNPAARLGRFTRTAKTPYTKGTALTSGEVEKFLNASKEVCPEYHPLFLMAVRAGLRRGELVAVRWGDIQFGCDENDPNRFIVVQHNYVRREHTTTKSKKSRRVDLSRELRRVLIELRDKRLLEAFLIGKSNISDELVFHSPEGTILDPDNLYHRYFLPVVANAGLRKIRLHDLRHTFGSLLIQKGASIVYVKEQMGAQFDSGNGGHLRAPDPRCQRLVRGPSGHNFDPRAENKSATIRNPGATGRNDGHGDSAGSN